MSAGEYGLAQAIKVPETGEGLLTAHDVRRSFGLTQALRGVDMEVAAGEVLAVMGPSGSGKSTLLHVLAGVIRPDQGRIVFDGQRIDKMNESKRTLLRLNEFGFVFQFGQLLPDLSALDNVAVPLLLSRMRRRNAMRRAEDILGQLGLAEHGNKLPAQLSGGQSQRVAVARALVTSPRVVFADEPTGSLDSLAAEQVLTMLTSLARNSGTAVVMITHDPRTAAYADREVVIRDGRVSGPPR